MRIVLILGGGLLSAGSTLAFLTTTPSWATRSKLSPVVDARIGILSRDPMVFHSKISSILQVASKPMQELKAIDSVEKKEARLLQSLQNYKNLEESSKPSVDDFVSLIDLWLTFPSPDRAEVILDRMEELYTPSGRIYERIINAWSFAASECIEKMRLMSREEPGNDEEYEEKRAKEIGALRGNALIAADKSAELLSRMEQLCIEIGDDFRPALSTYTSVINAISRSSSSRRELIEEIRERRDQIYCHIDKKRFKIDKNEDVFGIVMYLKDGEDMLRNKFVLDDDFNYVGNRHNLNIIILHLAKLGEAWAADASEEILDYMIRKHTVDNRLTPNLETINGCINSWAYCSASRAEGILEKLTKLQKEEGLLTHLTPDTVSYNTVIKAYANEANTKRAESILEIMEELYESTGDVRVKPDSISYGSVLNAFAKASHDPSAPNKAEQILMKMMKSESTEVNTWCFNSVLDAHASQGAGNRAFLLLKVMEDASESDEKITPDTYSYNILLKALAVSKEKGPVVVRNGKRHAGQIAVERSLQTLDKMENEESKIAKPDAISYNTVILAIANHGPKGASDIALSVLKRMEERYESGDNSVRPTSETYTSLIKAFRWGKDSTRPAEDLVQSLIEKANADADAEGSESTSTSTTKFRKLPDTPIYNALLNCWAKSGNRHAAQIRAEEILDEMTKFAKPNARTYAAVINILSNISRKRGVAKRAYELLELMEHLYENGDVKSRPNVYVYTSVINCYARSLESDKAVMAVSILQRMEEEYRAGNSSARPNIIAYNSVLNACAFTSGQAESIETAFKIACLVFDEVRSGHVKPSHVTYGTFLSVCANLMPESEIRDSLVEATFKRCARDGLVSDMVWRNLKAAASPELRSALLNQSNDNILEATWSRNL